MNRLRINFLYNSIFQVLTLIVPLLTTPYIARILGPTNLGVFSYVNANTNYFTIIASLGFNLFAQNEVSKARNNSIELEKIFGNILVLRLICSGVIFLIFAFFNFFVFKTFNFLYWILSFQIIAVAFDVSWLFMGLEEFKKISIRNLVVKVINTLLVFMLVRSRYDLNVYAFIIMFGIVISNLIIWWDVKKYIRTLTFNKSNFKPILFSSMLLFLPTAAITIYTDIVRTFLGIVTSKNYVAYYVQADMLIKVLLSIVTSLGTVMMPHISGLISEGNYDRIRELITKSFKIMSFVGIPITFLIWIFADDFVILFLGADFLPTAKLLRLDSISIVFAAWSNVLGIQFLLPTGKVVKYSISTTLPAISILINAPIFFIFFHVDGVMYAIVFVQVTIFIAELIYVWNDLEIKKMFINTPLVGICSIVMWASILTFQNAVDIHSLFLKISIGTILGGVVYIFVYFSIKKILNIGFERRG